MEVFDSLGDLAWAPLEKKNWPGENDGPDLFLSPPWFTIPFASNQALPGHSVSISLTALQYVGSPHPNDSVVVVACSYSPWW